MSNVFNEIKTVNQYIRVQSKIERLNMKLEVNISGIITGYKVFLNKDNNEYYDRIFDNLKDLEIYLNGCLDMKDKIENENI